VTSFGPCQSWPVLWSSCQELETASPTVTGRAVAAATHVLWSLTGQRFGECQVTLRPCRRSCYAAAPWPGGTSWPQPLLHGGLWFNLTCGGCAGDCSCSSLSEAVLPAPVSSIVAVKVDGVTLPVTGAYRIDDNRKLVRLGASWPTCNDLTLADTQPGTWSVAALYGEPVPDLGQLAVGELACELMKSMRGVDCRLPQSVTQLARQGVTISMPDPTQMLDKGRLGLYLSDLFIRSVNPYGLQSASEVFSVDHPRYGRRVGV
jgi:hypothetical protein